MSLDLLSRNPPVTGRCIFIPLYNVFCDVSLFYMSYNTIDCIFLIAIAVGARSVYVFLTPLVVESIRLHSAVGRWVSWHFQCVHSTINGDDVFDAMFVNGEDDGLSVYIAK